jgi:hypothetical protein
VPRERLVSLLRIAGIVLAVVSLLGLSGLTHDLFNRLAFTRSARTWIAWIGGLVLAGLFYALAEGGFEWITEGDRTTDPLGQRVVRLVVGMTFVAALLVAFVLLVRAFS